MFTLINTRARRFRTDFQLKYNNAVWVPAWDVCLYVSTDRPRGNILIVWIESALNNSLSLLWRHIMAGGVGPLIPDPHAFRGRTTISNTSSLLTCCYLNKDLLCATTGRLYFVLKLSICAKKTSRLSFVPKLCICATVSWLCFVPKLCKGLWVNSVKV